MYRKYIKAIINSYSEIIFLEGYFPGGILFLSTLINPNVGLAGLVCVLSSYVFALAIGMHKEFLKSGFYTYNPLLVGLSIGYLFKLNLLTTFFTITAGILAFVTTLALFNIFSYYLRLPVLSVPFVLVSSIAYLASSKYANLFVNSLYPHSFLKFMENKVPLWFAGLTKSLGAIFFSPHIISGLFFLLVLLFTSRILLFLAILGYLEGTFIVGIMKGSFYQAFYDINAFNFALIAMAIGGVFLIPSPKSYFTAMTAIAVSPFLLESAKTFWSIYGLPVFTLPFNIITLSFVYVLGLVGYPYLTKIYQGTPEKTLDYYLSHLFRFKGTERTLTLPFSGKWTIWQGINGKWTHKGPWRYAIDFVITDEKKQTYKGHGNSLEDYYCFKKPILSPTRGRVIKVTNNVPDNPPGVTDKERIWGNMVIIYDDRGFYVVIAHFLQDSIKVKEGEWVERGQMLGLCGNSGYSPQPHIHIHVQLTPKLPAPTVPFSFVQYFTQNHTKPVYRANCLPKEGEQVIPLYTDKALDIK
ncbi:MAG TPA: peptidase M23, partial [Candidatus Desulfofervidus auxilii]|nr:peptidase M23 [Candidatus Desulfofervidus auxilii]